MSGYTLPSQHKLRDPGPLASAGSRFCHALAAILNIRAEVAARLRDTRARWDFQAREQCAVGADHQLHFFLP